MAYRKINPLLWDDEWFIGLDDFHRNVWQAILTGPQVRNIPGLMVATAVSLADFMRRAPEAVGGALSRFVADGRVELDERARLLRVVNAPRWAAEHGEPENPNVLKGWWRSWKELPDSEVKRRHLVGLREAFVIARDRSIEHEKDDAKREARQALWDGTWTSTFGTVPRARPQTRGKGHDTPSGGPSGGPGALLEPSGNGFETVSGTIQEPSGSPPETVPEPFEEPSCDRSETVSARPRAHLEQEPEQEQEPVNPPYPPLAGGGAVGPLFESAAPRVARTRKALDDKPAHVLYAAAYANGMLDAGADGFTPPRQRAALVDMAIGFAKRDGVALVGADLVAWFRQTAAEYRQARVAKAEYENGFSPEKCLEWLKAGRPGARRMQSATLHAGTASDLDGINLGGEGA